MLGDVDRVDAGKQTVSSSTGATLATTSSSSRPVRRPGPTRRRACSGREWHRSVGEFYTYEGAMALRESLDDFSGGRLVVHVTEMPIKCPVAPLEFTFLADDTSPPRAA